MLKLFLSTICLSLCIISKAEDGKTINSLNNNTYRDIAEEIMKGKSTSILSVGKDIHDFSVVAGSRSLKYIFTTNQQESRINITFYSGYKQPIRTYNTILPKQYINKEYSALLFPYGKSKGILLSTKKGYIQSSISFDDGESWVKCKLGNYVTSSPLLYINNHKTASKHTAYFIGRGDLTELNSESQAMIYQITSTNGGKSWSNPTIAIKQNLYSLTSAAFFQIKAPNSSKEDMLYAITSCKETGNVFYSLSKDDGESWSYPLEIPSLKGTTNHIVSTHNDKVVLLYTKTYEETAGKKDVLFMFFANSRQFESGKFKGDLYRMYEYTPKMKTLLDNGNTFVDAVIYGSKHIIFSIASDWDGDDIYIKSMMLNLNRYY